MAEGSTNYKLPERIVTPWLEALQSGNYRQGRNYLYEAETDTYCCLGVLCRAVFNNSPEIINGKQGVEEKFIHNDFSFPEQQSIIGFGFDTGSANPKHLARVLAGLNDHGSDGEPMSFHLIADWIEENVETY